ncbi:uncharacterized protein [Triticum aestivum]|uniref:uncharacterized protein n=1 Tax=Triticum aestivum TaxID=4565 RepID=UPI001D017FB9|nr:uncharacterized protein LOC123076185 [Triticum aestivum]
MRAIEEEVEDGAARSGDGKGGDERRGYRPKAADNNINNRESIFKYLPEQYLATSIKKSKLMGTNGRAGKKEKQSKYGAMGLLIGIRRINTDLLRGAISWEGARRSTATFAPEKVCIYRPSGAQIPNKLRSVNHQPSLKPRSKKPRTQPAEEQGVAVAEKEAVAVEKWDEERKREAALQGAEKEAAQRGGEKEPQVAQDHEMESTEEEGGHFLPPRMAATTMAVSKTAIERRCSTDGSDGPRRLSPEEDAELPAPLNLSRGKDADGDDYGAGLFNGGRSDLPAGEMGGKGKSLASCSCVSRRGPDRVAAPKREKTSLYKTDISCI